MKKLFLVFCAVYAVLPNLAALDIGNGFSLEGGVKAGLLIKNTDYAGNLEGAAHGKELPLTLYFASEENNARNGEGWLDLDYRGASWGLHMGLWAHGDIKSYTDALHLGDHYIWANFLDDMFQFKGGQGGGTPITSGGWLDADWLGYTGLRLTFVHPMGISVGVNLVDPGTDGIKPVNYLSTIMFGAKYALPQDKFWVSIMWNNNPVYDDSEVDKYGGLHPRAPDADPIGQAGNVAFGIGVDKFFFEKGGAVIDGITANLGEADKATTGTKGYGISPVETTVALKVYYPLTEKIYTELKTKYRISYGDNADFTASETWGELQVEPYISYQTLEFLKFEFSFNLATFINSYYLEVPINIGGHDFKEAGQVPKYGPALDYCSTYRIEVKPAAVFNFEGCTAILGYKGLFSRDHVENTTYIDFRWTF